MKVFAVYDSKVESGVHFFLEHNNASGLRAFIDNIRRSQDSMFARHPEDYTLFVIGEYDEKNMRISSFDAPLALGCALEFINSEGQKDTGVIQLAGENNE